MGSHVLMQVRRARPEDHEAIGEATVAAYEDFLTSAEDFYIEHLRDSASRDRDAELWVAEDEETGEVLGAVTLCPVGSPWREIGADDEASSGCSRWLRAPSGAGSARR